MPVESICRGCPWVEAQLLAEIDYRAKSAEGKVRHPFLKDLREDFAGMQVSNIFVSTPRDHRATKTGIREKRKSPRPNLISENEEEAKESAKAIRRRNLRS